MNSQCPSPQQLSAYHDGELSGEQAAVVAMHLATCAACAAELAQLQKISLALAARGATPISQLALMRLHHQLDQVLVQAPEPAFEMGLVRLAWEVSGIAAAILLVGSVWLMHLQNSPEITASVDVPPWVDARVSADPVVQVAATPAAAWYLVDNKNTADIGP